MICSQLAQDVPIAATVGDRIVRTFVLKNDDGTAYTGDYEVTPQIIKSGSRISLTTASDWDVNETANTVTVELKQVTFTEPLRALWTLGLSLGATGEVLDQQAVGGKFEIESLGTTRPIDAPDSGVYDIGITTGETTTITISSVTIGTGGGVTQAEMDAAIEAAQTESRIADQAISAQRAVMITATGCDYFDQTDDDMAGRLFGVSETAAAIGAAVKIRTGGMMVGASGLTTGHVWCNGSAGQLSAAVPVSGVMQSVGYAPDANTLGVTITDPITR